MIGEIEKMNSCFFDAKIACRLTPRGSQKNCTNCILFQILEEFNPLYEVSNQILEEARRIGLMRDQK
tara:strand:- start:158 stop:358 length:201 start_codon:yes stop_codon:yes gene_type:complete